MSLCECAYSPDPSLLACKKYGSEKVSDKYLDLWPKYDTSWTRRYDRLKRPLRVRDKYQDLTSRLI